MPGQRRSAGPHARESWLPRLAGIGVVVLVTAGGVAGYLLTARASPVHHAAALPTKVISNQTVGLIGESAQAGSSGALVQLLDSGGAPQFTPLQASQAAEGSPQWTADQMAGNSYIFIYLRTGDCLSAGPARGAASRTVTLAHCDLGAQQRWRRTSAAVLAQGHDFYQYENLADGSCLAQSNEPGPAVRTDLAACRASPPISQLIAFWWSST
jgi:hypothetical protein